MEHTTDPARNPIETRVGSLSFRTPLIAASGTCGFGQELAPFGVLPALGAFVTKTVTREAREGNPPPRTCETTAGLLNSIGLANPGYEAFRREIVPGIPSLDCPCIANIGGETDDDYVELARNLADVPCFVALELNLSCPNVTGGMDLSQDRAALGRVTRAVRAVWRRPLWIKLTPNVTSVTDVAAEAADSGADAVVVANTYLGMALDWRARRSRLGRPVGGLSGPAIKPISLRLTWQAASASRLPVVACGGVMSAEDVLEYVLAGASAVEVGSLILRDPQAPLRIVGDLRRLLAEERIDHIEELRGALRR
jgi:dihydroorotate dehydrogenase (NAD+) catalytic subunit